MTGGEVSGSGFRGRFGGDYYDNIWTDMSEIVRPTRDGIHGREHISTSVAIGQMVSDLCGMEFDEEGNLIGMLSEYDCMKIALEAGYHRFETPSVHGL